MAPLAGPGERGDRSRKRIAAAQMQKLEAYGALETEKDLEKRRALLRGIGGGGGIGERNLHIRTFRTMRFQVRMLAVLCLAISTYLLYRNKVGFSTARHIEIGVDTPPLCEDSEPFRIPQPVADGDHRLAIVVPYRDRWQVCLPGASFPFSLSMYPQSPFLLVMHTGARRTPRLFCTSTHTRAAHTVKGAMYPACVCGYGCAACATACIRVPLR